MKIEMKIERNKIHTKFIQNTKQNVFLLSTCPNVERKVLYLYENNHLNNQKFGIYFLRNNE